MTYAFSLDASACSGCKACQEACKDRNGSPAGILLRRVVEVCGGEWQAAGDAWESSVFAYYLSLSCNHCVFPKCAGVCPTDAFSVRPDGIVLLDEARCMGCGYCAWACPYGAPQYDPARGVMAKCDFCQSNIDVGLPPTCVAACPLRVLDYVTVEGLKLRQAYQELWQLPANLHPFPLPEYSRTEPNLALKPHPAMSASLEKMVANREEIHPPQSADSRHGILAFRELPLVAFTLLAQTAAGLAAWRLVFPGLSRRLILAIGILLVAGGLTSFLHLGRKRNAWRSVIHFKKSWLSREVLAACLFVIAWAVTVAWAWLRNVSLSPWPMAILGLGLVYCMSMVYHLRAVPSWNTWRTPVTFFLSAAVLGTLGVRLEVSHPLTALIAIIALGLEMIMALAFLPGSHSAAGRLRITLLVLGVLGLLLSTGLPQLMEAHTALPILIIVLTAEAIGRWQFYSRRMPFPIRSR